MEAGHVEFTWRAEDPEGDALRAFIEVRASSSRSMVLATWAQGSNRALIELDEGEYEWRVTSYDDETSTPSQWVDLTVEMPTRYVFIDDLPSYIPRELREEVDEAIREGLFAWNEEADYRLLETSDEDEAYYQVGFVKDWGDDRLGTAYSQRSLEIGLGDSECDGVWTPYDADTVLRVSMHEMGHGIGLGHSDDEDDIMFPTMPKFYAAPCQFDHGTRDVEAGAGFQWTLRPSIDTEYHLFASVGSSNSLRICFEHNGGSGCGEKVSTYDEAFALSRGTWIVRIECANWLDTCPLTYRFARGETGDDVDEDLFL